MEGFNPYQSKPIERLAYRVKPTDLIHATGECQYTIKIEGNNVAFKAYETIFPGDYVVYLAADDVYHCRQAIFHERNVVQ